jgi:hypothetical protein
MSIWPRFGRLLIIYGKKAGEPYGELLRYWIEGENEILARIEQGDIKLFLSDDFINKSHQCYVFDLHFYAPCIH